MKKWFKYYLDFSIRGRKSLSIDNDFAQYCQAMGSYDADEAYSDKQAFFKKYFFDYHFGRLEDYDKFLRKCLDKNWDILSVASGRCANEMFLKENGYRITCSDLEIIKSHPELKEIFSEFEYLEINIIENPGPRRFDAIIALSLIFLFDEKNLNLFFKNAAASLKSNGHLIFDSSGSSDNLLSFLLHDIYLRFEVELLRLMIFLLKGKIHGFVKKHHGYRRTDREVIETARNNGFELVVRKNYGFLTEFKRSIIFNKIVSKNYFFERIFCVIGRNIPYTRIFDFKKIF